MKNSLKVLIILFFMTVFFGCNAGGEGNSQVGSSAPVFELKSVSGKTVSLKDYEGKAVLLDFGTSWCHYCVEKIPILKDIHKNRSGIIVLYIDVQENENAAKVLIEKYDIPYPVLLDKDGKVASEYKILGFPTILIVDKKGIIRYRGHSIPSDLQKFIE
ncbi:MAG: TlpA disulfide reductase family protein [Candidatus Omnitrophota bacterium]